MIKKSMCGLMLLLCAAFGFLAVFPSSAAGADSYVWITVQDDSGTSAPGTVRGQVTGPSGVLRKELLLDVDPSQVAKAQVQYEMKIHPYYPAEKRHYSRPDPDVEWGEMVILVNDEEVARKPLIELATQGWHSVDIDPELLVKGANTVKFGMASSPGYFYLAVDNTRNYGRSAASRDGGETFSTETLRPCFIDRDDPSRVAENREGHTEGEYMVRLRMALDL